VTTYCRRSVSHQARTGVRVDDQFGTIFVDTIKADRLLVPTAKSLTAPVGPPDPAEHHVDHFKCYTVKSSRGTTPFTPVKRLPVTDQFGQPKLYDVVKPTRLCNPADKAGEGTKSPDTHLMCYQLALTKTAPPQSKHQPVSGIFVANELAGERIGTTAVGELCVPSQEHLP
jgi:hypothetical protein